MSPITVFALAVVPLLAAGYTVGRVRPLRRARDWAAWQQYNRSIRRHSARWWARWAVLSAENLTWIVTHPGPAREAWKHRNDPPPPRGPAPQIDPNWAENRRAALREEQ